jgi:hypothetical protein
MRGTHGHRTVGRRAAGGRRLGRDHTATHDLGCRRFGCGGRRGRSRRGNARTGRDGSVSRGGGGLSHPSRTGRWLGGHLKLGVRRPCSRPPSSRPQPLRPSSLWRPSRPRRVGRHGAARQHRLAVECGRPVRLQWTPRGSTRRCLVFGRDRVTLCSLDRVLWRARVLESSSAPKRSLNSRARTTCEHSYLFFHNC